MTDPTTPPAKANPRDCPGCGCSWICCVNYRVSGKLCCPDCTHPLASDQFSQAGNMVPADSCPCGLVIDALKRAHLELRTYLSKMEYERDTLRAVQSAYINNDTRTGQEWNLAERLIAAEAELARWKVCNEDGKDLLIAQTLERAEAAEAQVATLQAGKKALIQHIDQAEIHIDTLTQERDAKDAAINQLSDRIAELLDHRA